MEISVSRDGRYLTIPVKEKIGVYNLTNNKNEVNLGSPVWTSTGSVNSYLWHHEESKLLATDISGKLRLVSFSGRNATEEIFTRGELLKSLIQRNLDFSNIKHVRCIAYHRRFCVIKNSATQIVGFLWDPPKVPEIVWAVDVSASAVFTVCDKGFLVFDPQLKLIYLYSIEDGNVDEIIETDFDPGKAEATKITLKSSPDSSCLGILLKGNLYLGRKTFEKLAQEDVTDFDIGEGKLSITYEMSNSDDVLQKLHAVYELRTLEKLLQTIIGMKESVIFAQRFSRRDKTISDKFVRDLGTRQGMSSMIKGNTCLSLLDNALHLEQLESVTNVLRVAENCSREEVDQILQRLNEYFVRDSTNRFALQCMGAAFSFAIRVLRKFPQHEFVVKFIFCWQNLVNLPEMAPQPYEDSLHRPEASGEWAKLSELEIIRIAILNNYIPLAQKWISENRPKSEGYSRTDEIRKRGLEIVRHELLKNRLSSLSLCDTLIQNLGCDVSETWKALIGKESDRGLRDCLLEILRMKGLADEKLEDACAFVNSVCDVILEFPEAAEKFPRVAEVRVSSALRLSPKEKDLLFAELFLITESEYLVSKVTAEDCWQVLLQKDMKEELIFWVRSQTLDYGAAALSLPYSWPISEPMIEMAGNFQCDAILDLLAQRGIFCGKERKELLAFLSRVKKIGKLENLGEIFDMPGSNILREDIDRMVIDYCYRYFKPRTFFSYAGVRNVPNHLTEPILWMKILQEAKNFSKNPQNSKKFAEIVNLSDEYLGRDLSKSEYFVSQPWVTMFHYLSNSPDITVEIFEKSLRKIPNLRNFSFSGPANHPTLLELLDNETPVRLRPLDHSNFPHFSNKQLSQKYGHIEKLNFTFYLRAGRPVRAFCKMSRCRRNRENRKSLAFVASSIALEKPFEDSVTNACVVFIELLQQDSRPLRTTLNVLDIVSRKEKISQDSQNLLYDVEAARTLKSQLEAALLKGTADCGVMEHWKVAVDFSRFYGLEEPREFLKLCAARNDFLNFLLFCQRFGYSPRIGCEMARKFESEPIGEHVQHVMELDTEAASAFLNGYPVQPPMKIDCSTEDFFTLLWQATQDRSQSPEKILEKAIHRQNVSYCIIAAILDPESIAQSLVTYLKIVLKNIDTSTDLNLRDLIHSALSNGNFKVIKDSFEIFIPKHPLCYVTQWLDSCRKGHSSDYIDSLIDTSIWESIRTYPGSLKDSQSIGRLVIDIINWTLCFCITNTQRRLAILDLLSRLPLSEVIDTQSIPDYLHLSSLLRCASEADIDLDIDQLLGEHSDFTYVVECQRVVRILLDGRHFESALKFANMANLPADSVLVTQLAEEFQDGAEGSQTVLTFFKRCHSLLLSRQIDPEVASGFFQDHVTKVQSVFEKYFVVRYSYWWKKRVACSSSDLAELESQVWFYRISSEIEYRKSKSIDNYDFDIDTELSIDLDFPPNDQKIVLLKSTCLEQAGTSNLAFDFPTIDEDFRKRIDSLIDQYIDSENLIIALKLSAMFKVRHVSLELLLVAMEAAEDQSNFSSALDKLKTLIHCKVSIKDSKMLIDYIGDRLDHGGRIFQKILTYSGVSSLLDLKYEYLAQHPLPVSILKMILHANSQSGSVLSVGGNMTLARNFISASGISQSEVLNLLCAELVEAARQAHDESQQQDSLMIYSLMHGQFNRLLTLCIDSTALGLRLLELSSGCGDPGTSVELLIFAHNCFTAACDVENIGLLLNRSKNLIDTLSQQNNWTLIVRLLTGIQRYSEMDYVFTLLKENDQFEYLLRKGMDRLPQLRVALLDFLRRNSAENRELFRMVALHFHMYSEVASMWAEEAEQFLSSVTSHQRKFGTTSDSAGSLPYLRNAPEAKRGLILAMQNLAHAAEYYIQAGKLRHASNCALQAELVALQISFIRRHEQQPAPATPLSLCILGLTPAEVDYAATEMLSYGEAVIVSRASGCSINWGRALFRHYVVNNSSRYLDDLRGQLQLSRTLVEQVVSAYESEFSRNWRPDVLQRLEKIVSSTSDLEFQYRLASRLGLRDLVQQLLSSPGVAYLKDTAWRSPSSSNSP